MSLSAALNTAKSSLAASQLQTQIVSSNIANVNTAGATRKIA
ncbi:flagellar basal body protein, partial [uncultured Aureimonas sp.]